MKIGFIGLGKLGLPVAETMAKLYPVIGYDKKSVTTNLITIATDISDVVKNSDIIFVAVPTPHDVQYDGSYPISHLPNKDFNYTYVIDVLKEIDKTIDSSKTVTLISTVLPGTIRRELKHQLTNSDLVYNPYLIAMGTVAEDFINPEMIMIGNESGELNFHVNRLIEFYNKLLNNNPRIVTGTWEEMECTKIFYNTFISAKLGLVNMIQDVAERIGYTNVDIVAKALADSTYRITGPAYMKPGMGDGGPCHPRDNIALRWLAKQLDLGYDLFDSIMHAREVQAENIAKELVKHNMPVVILGKSFKPGVEYIDGSYSILVGHYVEEMGVNALYDQILNIPAVYLLAHNIDYSTIEFVNGSIVVDPWRKLSSTDKIRVISYGNTRKPRL